MNYKSTNTEGRFTHFGGALVIGHEFGSGVEINPASSGAAANIMPAGDETDKSLIISGKGAGGVQIGGASTTAQILNQRYLVQFTVPALSSASSAESTITITGLTTNSAIFITPRTKLNSTVTGVFLTARCSTADELTVEYHNCSQSSLSGSTQSAYVFQIAF